MFFSLSSASPFPPYASCVSGLIRRRITASPASAGKTASLWAPIWSITRGCRGQSVPSDHHCIQRLMLSAAGPEPVGESFEVGLVDCPHYLRLSVAEETRTPSSLEWGKSPNWVISRVTDLSPREFCSRSPRGKTGTYFAFVIRIDIRPPRGGAQGYGKLRPLMP